MITLNGLTGITAPDFEPSSSTVPTNGMFLPTTNTLAWSTNSTERLRLDSSGNLGLGVTPPSGSTNPGFFIGGNQGLYGTSGVQVGFGTNVYNAAGTWKYVATAAATLYQPSSGTHAWYTAPSGTAGNAISFTQAMTLDASGSLLVGATSSSSGERFYVSQTNTGTVRAAAILNAGQYEALSLSCTYATYTDTVFRVGASRAANSAYNFTVFQANGVDQFKVGGSGIIYAQNTTVQSISDARLKENIRSSDDGLSVINLLRPVRFDWKEGYGNDRKNQLGFIAQEVESVFPDAVDEWTNIKEGDDEAYKTVGPSALIPVLVKAIQELSAELNELKQKVNA